MKKKRKYVRTADGADEWVAEHKRMFKDKGMRFVHPERYTKKYMNGFPPDFATLQQRHQSAVTFFMGVCKQDQLINKGSVAVVDLNMSLRYALNCLSFDSAPCLSKKTLLAQVFPRFELLSPRVQFDLQGLDSDAWEQMHTVARTALSRISGDSFVMPQAAALFLSVFLVFGVLGR